MKKITSLVMTALLISTVSGCTGRNTAMKNYGNNPNPGTTQGTRTGYQSQTGTTQVSYRDGVYVGVGDGGTAGNQTATVIIKGGKITNITLKTIDNKGNEIYPPNMGTTQGTTGNIINGTNAQNGTTNNYANQGARTYGTPGATTGGMAGGMAGNVNEKNTTGNTGRTGINYGAYGNTNTGTTTGMGAGGTTAGTAPGTTVGTTPGTTAGTAGSGNLGTTTGGVNTTSQTRYSDYERARTQLATAMINAQTYNVNLTGNNTSVAQNWKLAVRRALDKARY